MTTENYINNDNDNEDHSLVISDNVADVDLLEVFKALESIGFRFPDYHEN